MELDDKQGLDEAFDRAARRYDLLTALNPGYHRHLRSAATELVRRAGAAGPLLDLGCGSGSSTAQLVALAPAAELTGIDASLGMLGEAAAKPWPDQVRFVHASAQQLAEVVAAPQRGILAAYLFRNLSPTDRDEVLTAALAALEPGGWLVVQEYSVAGSRLAQAVWTAVCWAVVIPLSALVGGSPRLYRYLWRSVLDFDSPAGFAQRLLTAGFTEVASRTVGGWQRGILHTFVGRRPA